jgi:hypothetical protein
MRWVGHVAHMDEMKNAYKVSAEKPETKGPLGRPKPWLEANIRIVLRELGCETVDWIHLA